MTTNSKQSWFDDRPWMKHHDPQIAELVQDSDFTSPELWQQAVAESGDHTALQYFDWSVTYREADELVQAAAAMFLEAGLKAGDRIGIILQNVPAFTIAAFAAWRIGAAIVPLNPMYRDELLHAFSDAEVSALIAGTKEYAANAAPRVKEAGIQHVWVIDEFDLQTELDEHLFKPEQRVTAEAAGAPDFWKSLDAFRGQQVEQAEISPDDLAAVFYTSGTSGTAKGAMNSHRNLAYNGKLILNMGYVHKGDPVLVGAPLFHITGFVVELLGAVAAQGALVMTYRFEPTTLFNALRTFRPAMTVAPATAFIALLSHPAFTEDVFDSLRTIISGGAAVPAALVDTFAAKTNGRYLTQGYGLTETSAPCVIVPLAGGAPVDPESGNLSIGVPTPATMVRIVDEEGQDVGPNEVGEITLAGPSVIAAYLNRPEATAEQIPNGVLHTGDMGFMDEDGWIYIVDRKKDMINASGFKVWPREVEDVLYQHPSVLECAVVGRKDAYRGEAPVAFVTEKPGMTVTPDELIKHCKDHLASYKTPTEVHVVDEMPKTPSGKILRREMRKSLNEGRQ